MPFEHIKRYFETKGFQPFPFQIEAWTQSAAGSHQLIQCPTGSGKTLAATGAMIDRLLAAPDSKGLRLLYVTPRGQPKVSISTQRSADRYRNSCLGT